jgi:hypothetical protein
MHQSYEPNNAKPRESSFLTHRGLWRDPAALEGFFAVVASLNTSLKAGKR